MVLGRLVSNTGSHIHRVALTVFVLSMYGTRVYGTTMTVGALPPIIFVVVGGVICDRYPKARIMASTDLFSGLVFASLAVYLSFNKLDVSVLYVLVFLGAAAGALFNPASASILPSLVPRSDIGRATSVISASDSVVAVGGPGLGGVLTSIFGPVVVFTINSVSFFVSGISEFFIRARRIQDGPRGGNPLRDIVDGFRYFAREKTLGGVAAVFGVLNFVGTPLFLYPPIFAAERFGQSAFGIGLTFIATSFGGAAFSLLLYVRRDLKRKGLMMLTGTITAGILGALLPSIDSFWLFLVALVLIGSTFGININLLNIILRTRVEETYLGRAHSFFLLLVTLLIPAGYAAFTWLLEVVGLDIATIVAGVSVVAVAFCFLLIRDFRRL